jgi:hypothetical protein
LLQDWLLFLGTRTEEAQEWHRGAGDT